MYSVVSVFLFSKFLCLQRPLTVGGERHYVEWSYGMSCSPSVDLDAISPYLLEGFCKMKLGRDILISVRIAEKIFKVKGQVHGKTRCTLPAEA